MRMSLNWGRKEEEDHGDDGDDGDRNNCDINKQQD